MITASDKKTRDKAIPFRATDYRNNSSGTINSGLLGATDAAYLQSTALTFPIRCATPDRGVLTEAHLNLVMQVHAATTVKVAIGRFDTDGITAISSYTQEEIDAMHKILTGSSAAIASSGGTLFIDGLNLMPLLPKRGDANFNADGFVVVFQFDRARTSANDKYKRFEVMCSAQMGLV